ncbi:uncharacterized protein LOC116212539 [Punica granatum]|nr:uncharacterized protein LOC116212539 [Punica granatum]
MAKPVSALVNMYRITGDDWDNWGDVAAHFDVSRDMASAGLIGRDSRSGKSWPDLDMLPLGWLTDPGSNDGPHRYSRLTLHEQRTQMTLWGFARSPLMFGGDVRKLDDTTLGLITNPTLLNINSFSSNNKEFPYVTASTAVRGKNLMKTGQLRRVPADVREPEIKVLGLTSCTDSEADGWSVTVIDHDLEKICWKAESHKSKKQPLCLYKRNPPLTSDEEMISSWPPQSKLQLSASCSMDICLDASPKQRLTAREIKRGTFSRCRWEANQMWEFHGNGSLVNSYSRQCAVVRKIKVNGVSGVRSWVATGREGEIYMAFFNLNPRSTTITAQISDLGKVLPVKVLSNATCNYMEVWSNRDLGTIAQTISYAVEGHGTALFVLRCQ